MIYKSELAVIESLQNQIEFHISKGHYFSAKILNAQMSDKVRRITNRNNKTIDKK